MKLVLNTIAALTVINMCCTTVAFPDRAEGDDIQDARRHVAYLIQILDKLGELSDLKDIAELPPGESLASDYDDFDILLDANRGSDRSRLGKYITHNQAGRDEFNSILADTESGRNRFPDGSDNGARFTDIQKKDFSILPPSNEWCRMMGFRRCRRYRS